jgi:hypothetical protein
MTWALSSPLLGQVYTPGQGLLPRKTFTFIHSEQLQQRVQLLPDVWHVGDTVRVQTAFINSSATTPSLAERFLSSFASSAPAHYTEQGLRLLVGAAMVNFASAMWYPERFQLFGWLIVVTAVALLVTPWQWHHKFSSWVMPLVIRHLRLFAFGAAALAAFILYGVSRTVIS